MASPAERQMYHDIAGILSILKDIRATLQGIEKELANNYRE